MDIAVYGLGYVGAVSAACLARDGHTVIGVDPQPSKVDLINSGQAPMIEGCVGEIISSAVSSGDLRAVGSAEEAVPETDLSFICVGTPSRRNGSLDTSAVVRVCEQIGEALKVKSTNRRHTIVVRSTILPGTMRELVVPTLEAASGMKAGEDFGVANNPEFLREGTAVYDYDNPPKTVIGADDAETHRIVARLYEHLDAPMVLTSMKVGELVKYADNAWHAVKVAFGNEIGNISKAVGVDSHDVMDIFVKDRKLNISNAYLKPGFAFGGSCLPKDVRALTYKGRQLDLELPLLNSVLPSNTRQIDRAFEHIERIGKRRIAFLGVSFKPGTDDLRESPQIELVEKLIGKGYDVRIYDKNVHMAKLMGANREFVIEKIPHIFQLLSDDLDDVLTHGQIVVIGNNAPEFHSLSKRLHPSQTIYDLARIDELSETEAAYDGVNW
ncbi:MAG: nucleotide sugar dehydrogenase [Pseudomonadota bacterium]